MLATRTEQRPAEEATEPVIAGESVVLVPPRLVECFSNKWWRLNNLYWIIDEQGRRVKFRPNADQEKLYDALWHLNIVLKARQHGITTFVDLYFLDDCLFIPDIEAGIVAHHRDDAAKIFRRKVKYPYDNLPSWLRRQRPLLTNSKAELVFSNNSTIYVATSLRSGTVQRLHVSEHAKICKKYPAKAEEVKAGTLNAIHVGQIVVVESTAEGRQGDFHDWCRKAEGLAKEGAVLSPLDFKFHFFPWFENPSYSIHPEGVVVPAEVKAHLDKFQAATGVKLTAGQIAWYTKKVLLLGWDTMFREYPGTPEEAFNATVKGSYYALQMSRMRQMGQLVDHLPHIPALPVNTAWDVGHSDTNCIIFHQRLHGENRLVDFYYNSGEDLSHYAKVLQDRGYVYGEHILPWEGDAAHKIITGQSAVDRLRELMPGQRVQAVAANISVNEGINSVRMIMPTLRICKTKCAYLIDALDHYCKAWNETTGDYHDRPVHNWASHPADALRTLATGFHFIEGVPDPGRNPAGRDWLRRGRRGAQAV